MIIKITIIIVFVLLVFLTIKNYINAEKKTNAPIKMRTGEPGSGKTGLCALDVIKDYKKLYAAWKKNKKKNLRPVIYSNIPFRINRKLYAEVLTREHLLLQELFPDDVIPLVIWDEVGLSANQYSYDDPNIMTDNINDSWRCVEVFIRLFRHFFDDGDNHCRLYMTDQACGDVCIQLRRRMGQVDVLRGFERWLGFMPFYRVYVTRLQMHEDSIQNVNQMQITKDVEDKYYFGFLPYKWMSVKHYDTLCYSEAKEKGFTKKIEFSNWKDNPTKLKTCYMPDLRLTREELAIYKHKIRQLEKEAVKNCG